MVFGSVRAYNFAVPQAPMPSSVVGRNLLRSFTSAGAGLLDDLTMTGTKMTLDFLPGGAPDDDEPERLGAVVASRWGNEPYLVLAMDVPLRAAWNVVVRHRPVTLSAVEGLLRRTRRSD
ncbi:hypothetical protein CFP71_14985 [Amycolatopsis thailandensis]|uniref:Uncharacterized protein n=2 Tax=Amycolatopsis thailandensis TaxID=589330 RepID=A0A229SBG8_9PSEU|nr:hypothetical protein CFP71_14985 [Amycolatopsis thailandensis]